MTATTCRQCGGKKYRVLVVDDHPLVRKMLANLIEDNARPLDVNALCEAASAEEAIAQARIYKPHVVLMDISLPGINGLGAARRIKEDHPSVQIVMVTAVGEPSQRQEAATLGAAGFLTKDQVATDLVPLLSGMLGRLRQAE